MNIKLEIEKTDYEVKSVEYRLNFELKKGAFSLIDSALLSLNELKDFIENLEQETVRLKKFVNELDED